MSGAVVLARYQGHAFSALRTNANTAEDDGSYGRMTGATAQLRFKASSVPAGVSVEDGKQIEIQTSAGGYDAFRISGLSLTCGIYRCGLTDWF